jgi:hypothetical protein
MKTQRAIPIQWIAVAIAEKRETEYLGWRESRCLAMKANGKRCKDKPLRNKHYCKSHLVIAQGLIQQAAQVEGAPQ